MSSTKDYILSELQSKVTFKNKRRLRHVCSDAMQLIGKSDKEIALKTNLSASTIARMRTQDPAPSGADYNPNINTLEAILEASDACIEIKKR